MIASINNLGIQMQLDWLGVGLCAGTMCFLIAIPFIIGILIAVWMYKDAKKRGENAVLWLIVGLLLPIIGLIIWLIVRPKTQT